MDVSESDLRNVAADLIAEAISTAKELYNGVFPIVAVPTMWEEPQEDGGYQGERKSIAMLDLGSTWNLNRDMLAIGPKWLQANAVIKSYQQGKGTSPDDSSFLAPDLCSQIVTNYLKLVESFELQEDAIKSVCEALIAYCNSAEDVFRSVVALEGFNAPEAFQLVNNGEIRPVTLEELEELGQDHPLVSGRRYDFEAMHPRSDWWICEFRQSGAKGTPLAWNNLHRVFPYLGPCLRLFKTGQCKMDTIRISNAGSFGPGMYGSGGRANVLSWRGDPYSLTADEVRKLQGFWPKFLVLMKLDNHYLQLPARRLEFGGERIRLEDSLIDYMIGLESLLGKAGERTEMGYRMAMRGAMVLSPVSTDRSKRFAELRDLYNLRSRLVHGENLEPDKLGESVDLAEEALRSCWHWFFNNRPGDSDNKKGIDEIDSRLLLQSA